MDSSPLPAPPASSSSREGRAPPRLKREIRIPVLQIQKLPAQGPPLPANKTRDSKDDGNSSPSTLSPGLTAPPQLEPALVVKVEDFSGPGVDVSDQDEEADEEATPLEREKPVLLGRRVRRYSSVSESSNVDKTEKSTGRKAKGRSTSTNEPVRKIIQSIFVKPKPQKPRRSRRGKGKSTPKKAGKGQGSTLLKIKIPSASSRRLRKEEEEKAAAASSEVEMEEEAEEDMDADVHVNQVQEDTKSDYGSEVKVDDDGDEDDNEGSIAEELRAANSNKGDSVSDGAKKDEDEDDASKKSEDEDDLSDEIDQDDWKPVRAAMVAAMELVAKRQVTDDMRVDRRVRKPNFKPFPRGRGRRTIFKKMSKPTQSCQETASPTVLSAMYYNGNYYQKGDIVYLLPSRFLRNDSSSSSDSDEDFENEEDKEIKPDVQNFFQIRGFLRTGVFESCASVLHLKPKPDRVEESPFPFDPAMFSPDYRQGETMVKMGQLKFVLHCPIDLYHGHDVTYGSLVPGSIYARLGTSLIYNYQISHPDLPDIVKVDEGETNASSDSTTSQSIGN